MPRHNRHPQFDHAAHARQLERALRGVPAYYVGPTAWDDAAETDPQDQEELAKIRRRLSPRLRAQLQQDKRQLREWIRAHN